MALNAKYLSIGDITFDKVEMTFVNDSLESTTLFRSYDFSSFETLRTSYLQEFGEPSEIEEKDYGNQKQWGATWKGQNVRIHFDSVERAVIIISYSSSHLNSYQVEQDCKEKGVEKAKKDI